MGRISQIPVPVNTLDVPEAFEPHPLVRHPDVENVERPLRIWASTRQRLCIYIAQWRSRTFVG